MKVVLAACLALAAPSVTYDTPRFIASKGGKLTSAWRVSVQRETVACERKYAGIVDNLGLGSTSTNTRVYELSDEFLDVDGGGSPLTIVRSFETLHELVTQCGFNEVDSVPSDSERESELAGNDVVLSYHPEHGEWSALYAEDSEGSERWLEDLAPRVDLPQVLAGIEGEIEVGATWSLPLDFLTDVLYPGGKLMRPAMPEADERRYPTLTMPRPNAASIERQDELEGKIMASLTEVEEVDDVRLATILVEVSVDGALDVSEDLARRDDRRGSRAIDTDATLKQALEGELIIIWNLTANRPDSLEGELSGHLELDVDWSAGRPNFKFEQTFHEEQRVTHTIAATFDD